MHDSRPESQESDAEVNSGGHYHHQFSETKDSSGTLQKEWEEEKSGQQVPTPPAEEEPSPVPPPDEWTPQQNSREPDPGGSKWNSENAEFLGGGGACGGTVGDGGGCGEEGEGSSASVQWASQDGIQHEAARSGDRIPGGVESVGGDRSLLNAEEVAYKATSLPGTPPLQGSLTQPTHDPPTQPSLPPTPPPPGAPHTEPPATPPMLEAPPTPPPPTVPTLDAPPMAPTQPPSTAPIEIPPTEAPSSDGVMSSGANSKEGGGGAGLGHTGGGPPDETATHEGGSESDIRPGSQNPEEEVSSRGETVDENADTSDAIDPSGSSFAVNVSDTEAEEGEVNPMGEGNLGASHGEPDGDMADSGQASTPAVEEEEVMTFEEFKRKMREQEDGQAMQRSVEEAVAASAASKRAALTNYASFDCGAKVIETNKEAQVGGAQCSAELCKQNTVEPLPHHQ